MKPLNLKDLILELTPLGGKARLLVNSPELRLVNLCLEAGETVAEHSVDIDVVFLALNGRGIVTVDGSEIEIIEGQYMVCPAGAKRKVESESGLSLLVIRSPNR
ncbi:MAG: cupin domain-containing protein [Chitinophagales bacterium]